MRAWRIVLLKAREKISFHTKVVLRGNAIQNLYGKYKINSYTDVIFRSNTVEQLKAKIKISDF